MKTILYLLIIALMSSCAAVKPAVISYNNYSAEKEVVFNGTKNDLFVMANLWVVEAFTDARNIIQYTEKDAGIIKGRCLINTPVPNPKRLYSDGTEVNATITIQVKDNLTKITIAPQGIGFYHPMSKDSKYQKASSPSADEVKSGVASIIEDYKAFIEGYNKW